MMVPVNRLAPLEARNRRGLRKFRCGFFGSSWRNPATRRSRGSRNPRYMPTPRTPRAGPALAHASSEHLVFRAAVLSIVLTLAVGPGAAVLCSVWCHPGEAQSSPCPHQDGLASPRVTGEDSCRTAPGTTTGVVREERKTGFPNAHRHHAAVIGTSRSGAPPSGRTGTSQPGQLLDRHGPPVLTVLRV